MEKLLWQWFNRTGRLDLYLLYRDFIKIHDNQDSHGKKYEGIFLSDPEGEELLL